MSADSEQLSPVEVLAEEFLERQQRGEKPTIAEYCERHPELAEEIREVFEALAMMEELKPDSHDVTGSFGASIQQEGKRLERVGDYRILREIGRGGMGIVYEAEQESLRRRVALKVLSKRQTADARGLQRFQREARAAARMHHTNIVPVFDVGDDEEHVYYAMQMIQGQGLDLVIDDLRRLRTEHVAIRKNASVVEAQETRDFEQRHSIAASLFTGKFHQENLIAEARREERSAGSRSAESTPRPAASSLDPQALGGAYAETVLQDSGSTSAVLPGHSQLSTAETNRGAYFRSVAEIGLQTGRALSYAHARGIIHRDIKPSNLLLDAAGVVWVTDFGLAKTSDEAMTHTGDVLGTIRYMSPERFKGQCDVRADIYALGLTLYELLVLRPAYASPDRLRLIELVSTSEPPTPRSLDPRIPRDLETIILKSIDKDPRRRYQSADELCEDLERFIQDEPIKARRISLAERCARWARRNKSLAATLAVLITVVTSVAIGSTIMAGYFRNLNQKLGTTLADLEREKGISDTRAQENQELAVAMRAEANRAGIAEDQALEALGTIARQQELMRLNSFVTETQLAQLVGETGDLAARERWLGNWRTTDPERDLRGWEWYQLMCEGQRDFYEIRNHDDMLICIEWSPDGTHIASGGYSGDIHISDAQSGELRQTLKGHGSYVYAVRWNKTGNRLVSCGYDGTIRIWDVNTGQVIRQIDIPEAYVYGVDWDPAGERIASTERDGPVRIWNAETGEELASFHIDVELLAMIAWHPQEDRIAVSGLSQNVYVLDAATGAVAEILQHPADAYVYGLDWSPDGERLVTGDFSGNCCIWQPGVSELIATIEQRTQARSVAWSPNGRWLAIARPNSGVAIIDAETHEELLLLRGDPGYLQSVGWSHDSRRLASTEMDGSIRIWDVSDPESVPEFVTGSHAVTASDWGADSRYFYTGDDDGRVRGWNAATGEPMPGFEFSDRDLVHIEYVRLSPNGTQLAVGGRPENDVWIVDAESGDAVRRLQGPALERSSQQGVRAIAWDESNERLAVGDSSGGIWIADLQTGEYEQLHQFSGEVHDLCYLPQAGGRWLIAVSKQDNSGGVLRAFDLESGEIEQEVRFGMFLWSLAVDRQGTRIAVGGGLTESGDRGSVGLARVWRVHREDDRLELRDETTLEGPGTLVDKVQFSPDSRRLMGVERDGRAFVWDVTGDLSIARRRLLMTLDSDFDEASSLAISPDGLQVAITSADGSFRVWNAFLGYKNELSPVLLPMLEQKALAGTATADDLLLRTRILTRRADWSTAAASLEALSELPNGKPWYISDLWVLDGPFPGEIETLHAPEVIQGIRDGDVLEPVESEAGDSQQFQWRPRTLQENVVIDFGEMFNNSSNVAGYALLRIYSPREQSVGLVFGADDHLRLWINGELLQTVRPGGANPDDYGRPIDLQRGWNTLLAKVVNLQGRHQLFLNLSEEPRLLALLYEEAGEFAAAEEMWKRAVLDSIYYTQISYAHFLWRRGRFEDAQRELDQTLENSDTESDDEIEYLRRARAGAYFDQERYEEALAELDRAIELVPESTVLLRTRADYNARLRRYAAAAVGTRAIIDLDPTEHWGWVQLSQLLLETGDVAGYEALRQEMLEQWRKTDDPTLAERTIKACLMNPADTETLNQLELLLPVVLSADQEHQYYSYFLAVQGFLDYRRGVALLDAQNSEEARTLFQSALGFFSRARSRGIGAKWAVHVDLCTAMTLFRMQIHGQAESTLADVEVRLASSDFAQTSDPLDVEWNEDLMIRHTYREAISLIRGPAYEELDLARETLAAGDLAAAADHLETAVSMTGTAPVILREAIELIDHGRAGYVPLISTSESEPETWQVAVAPPATGWETEADAAADDWESQPGPFGSYDVQGIATTPWTNENEIWLRKEFEISDAMTGPLVIWAWCDDQAEFYLNGVVAAESGWTEGEYRMLTLRPEAVAAIRPGRNVLAVHASNTIGGGALDVGLYRFDGQSRRAVLDAIETGLASAQLSGMSHVDALIQLDRWHEAALAMREHLRLKTAANLDNESIDWMRYVTLHSTAYSEGQGEMQDYVAACHEMMDRYRDVSHLTEQEQRMVTERIVKCCCLLPADIDWSAFDTGPGRMAFNEGRLENWQYSWYAMSYGLESLRLGGPDNSRDALALVQHGLDTLQHTRNADVRKFQEATLHAIASLAHLALGDREQAEASLAAAIAATPPVLEHNPDGSIVGHTTLFPEGSFRHDLLPPVLLIREATAALEP